ncbi:MAG: hypothetical protein JNJ54_12795 [Myxococcaceae bacterium]|nr:hypothetical protein [Myxococcaceae bacterium]
MSDQRPIPQALLERYAAGDLSGEALERVERALASSPAEKARLDELRADSAAFLVQQPPGPVAAKLEAPARPRWMFWVPLVALAAGLLVFIAAPPVEEPDSSVKGAVGLTAFRQRADGTVETLTRGQLVRPGDAVRFQVTAPGPGFVAVLSRDGARKATTYHPFNGPRAVAFDPKQPLLETAIALDDVKGRETVWLVFGQQAFELAPLMKQLEEGREPSAAGLSVASLEWMKE